MLPSPTDIKYFHEVARAQNMSHAARCLGITQPSLTLAIKRIEACMGIPVIIRLKRGVTLTRAGKQLLAHTRQLTQYWDSIKHHAIAVTNEVQGTFTLGCHPSIALCTLPAFLTKLLTSHPKLEIHLVHDLSRKITEQVVNLHLDLGIVVNPLKHPDLIMKKLMDDKVTLWRSPQFEEEQIQSVLLCDLELSQTQSILKKLKKQGKHYDRMLPSTNLEVIARLTENGCGIGILPGKVAKTRNLVPLKNVPFYNDEFYLLYRGENRDVRGIQVIAEAIKNAFSISI